MHPNLRTSLEAERRYYAMVYGSELDAMDYKYSPNQPRVPAGNPEGGQWANGGGHTLTVHSNLKISIHHPDGSMETRINGSRAWRNHNPGNIIAGDFAQNHGAIGRNHGFAVFPDETVGHAASESLLRTSTYAKLTVNQAIARRSPSNENPTAHVQHSIRVIGRFSGDEVVGDLNPEQLSRLAEAIKKTEGWLPGTVIHTPQQ